MTTSQVNPAPRLDNQDPALFGQTPSQTVGPFFHYGLPWTGGADLVGDSDIGARLELTPPEHYVLASPSPKSGVRGEVITLEGMVTDADGKPVNDALIEIWQADGDGRYADGSDPDGFIGFGRSPTGEDGVYRFRTVRPGRVDNEQAPHIAVSVFARGVLKRLVTRIYFEGDPANAADPVLALAPAERRGTLVARKDGDAWRFDIVLQGAAETVFFDV